MSNFGGRKVFRTELSEYDPPMKSRRCATFSWNNEKGTQCMSIWETDSKDVVERSGVKTLNGFAIEEV